MTTLFQSSPQPSQPPQPSSAHKPNLVPDASKANLETLPVAPESFEAPALPEVRGFLYDFDSWGEPFWQVMHAVTFSYPDEPDNDTVERTRIFFRLVPFILPCGLCGMHFHMMMRDAHPLSNEVLSNRDKLSRWLVTMHNGVNRRLKKQVVQYDDVKRFYLLDRKHNLRKPSPAPGVKSNYYKTAAYVLLVLFLLTLVALVFVFIKYTPSRERV